MKRRDFLKCLGSTALIAGMPFPILDIGQEKLVRYKILLVEEFNHEQWFSKAVKGVFYFLDYPKKQCYFAVKIDESEEVKGLFNETKRAIDTGILEYYKGMYGETENEYFTRATKRQNSKTVWHEPRYYRQNEWPCGSATGKAV